MTLSYLQGESQVYVFHLLVEVGFLPFYEQRLFELQLVFSSCRVQDLDAVQCAGCSARLWTLQMSQNVRKPVGKEVLKHLVINFRYFHHRSQTTPTRYMETTLCPSSCINDHISGKSQVLSSLIVFNKLRETTLWEVFLLFITICSFQCIHLPL